MICVQVVATSQDSHFQTTYLYSYSLKHNTIRANGKPLSYNIHMTIPSYIAISYNMLCM